MKEKGLCWGKFYYIPTVGEGEGEWEQGAQRSKSAKKR